MPIVYLEGAFMGAEEAKIPISDRGFQFGDGAYATIQVNEGIPLFLKDHLEQLRSHCASLNLLMPPLDYPIITELIRLNGADTGIWRLKIYVTGGDNELMRLPQRRGRLVITLKPFTPLPFKKLIMGIYPIPYSSCHAAFKSLAHLNRYYVMEQAHTSDLDDAVTTTEKGILLEAAFGNLFWIKGGSLYTPDPTLSLYFGVTLKNIIQWASCAGFSISHVQWPLSDIPSGCAAFRSGSMHGILPIERIADRAFVQDPSLYEKIIRGYKQLIEREKKGTPSRSP